MKRVALTRKTPLGRSSQLARTGAPERKTRIKPVSDKRKAGGPERQRQVAAAFIRDGWTWITVAGEGQWVGGRCIPHERGWPGKCFGKNPTPHRLRKGSAGGGYTTDNVVAACAFSNGDIENHPRLAERLGLVR